MRNEIESISQLVEQLNSKGHLRRCYLQSLHLEEYDFHQIPVAGAIFLGCKFAPGMASVIRRNGGLIFPRIPNLPFNPYRAKLWTADTLYQGITDGYLASLDGRLYRWWKDSLAHQDLDAELACTLHDYCISEALTDETETLAPKNIIGVMGGHAAIRGSASYLQAAKLGWLISQSGKTVITGGGPGAMEAANLGGACQDGWEAVASACAALKDSATWDKNPTAWVKAALNVKSQADFTRLSLGVPTWFYGHEPPNVFATGISKFFNNALREEKLLTLATGGIIYTPGAAGTVQEIFQLLTPNYYAATADTIKPMVFLGIRYWQEELPVWPLIQKLAQNRLLAEKIYLVDDVEHAIAVLQD